MERPRQDRDGGSQHRRREKLEAGTVESSRAAEAQVRYQTDWDWDGKPTKIVSRATDEKGNVQPDRNSFISQMGTNALFHYNAQQTWNIDQAGRVRNALA